MIHQGLHATDSHSLFVGVFQPLDNYSIVWGAISLAILTLLLLVTSCNTTHHIVGASYHTTFIPAEDVTAPQYSILGGWHLAGLSVLSTLVGSRRLAVLFFGVF